MPVKLYSAVEDRAIHFHLLEVESKARVHQRMVDPDDEERSTPEQVRKGFEIEPGTFVLVEPGELKAVEPKPSRDIHTMAFVPWSRVGPQWYERPYYLGPDGDAEEYFALAEALAGRKRIGIAQWVMRKRQYFGALRPHGKHLLLVAIRNTEEVLSPMDLPSPGKPPDSRESTMAEQLVMSLDGEFRPEEFRDEYRERVQAFLKQKAKGKAPQLRAVPKKKTPESLLDALSASLNAVGRKGKAVA